MKTHILPILSAGFLLVVLCGWSAAAPAPEAGLPKEIASFQAHLVVEGLAFSPDGKTLASSGREGNVKLWDVASWKNTADFAAHSRKRRSALGVVLAVAFSPDSKTLATSDDDRTIKLWDAATRKNTDSFDAAPTRLLLFSPDGKTLVAEYEMFDLETKKSRKIVEIPPTAGGPVAAFTPKGKLLVGMSFGYPDPPSFAVWDRESGKIILKRKSSRKSCDCGSFSPDGKTVVSTEGDYDTRRWVIRLWDIAGGKNTATFEQPELPCHPTFSPDGKVLAVSCRPAADRNDYPGSIRLFEVPSGKVLATLKGYKRVVNRLVFSPDGRLLATGTLDGVIKSWSLPKRYKAE
jgi:WD40 repeat protein